MAGRLWRFWPCLATWGKTAVWSFSWLRKWTDGGLSYFIECQYCHSALCKAVHSRHCIHTRKTYGVFRQEREVNFRGFTITFKVTGKTRMRAKVRAKVPSWITLREIKPQGPSMVAQCARKWDEVPSRVPFQWRKRDAVPYRLPYMLEN